MPVRKLYPRREENKMGRYPTKAAGNRYYESRKNAAEHDERLTSREAAGDLLGVSWSSLADYSKVNRRMAYGRWRDVIGAYPGFQGSKRPTRNQPVLVYPVPAGVKSWRDLPGVAR